LVEPDGVDRSVDEDGVGPLGAETLCRLLTPVTLAVIDDPEDAVSGPVRRNAVLVTHFTKAEIQSAEPRHWRFPCEQEFPQYLYFVALRVTFAIAGE
jgi:hypothetical protein